MNESKSNIPKLRFPGFTGPWEQRKLGEVAEIVGGGTPNTGNPEYWDGDINWFAPAEISDVVYVGESVRKITEKGYAACSATMLPADKTILFTSRAGIGNTAILRRSACTNQGFQSLVVNDGCDVYFVYSATPAIKKWAEIHASGSTFLEISGKVLAGMPVRTPSLFEQRLIGTLFRDFDDLITLRQRELDHTKLMKRGLLQKMFPKGGADVPELRFPGFTGPWEQRKSREIFRFRNERNRPDLPVLSATQDCGMVYRDEGSRVVGHNVKNEAGYKRVVPGDFVIHLRSFQGGFAHSTIEGIASPAYTILAFRDCDEHDDFFWKQFFSSDRFIQCLGLITYGIRDGRSISVEEFLGMRLVVPSLPEQRRIGALFRAVDDLITLRQRELEHMKLLKKALLQQMFV